MGRFTHDVEHAAMVFELNICSTIVWGEIQHVHEKVRNILKRSLNKAYEGGWILMTKMWLSITIQEKEM